jgi:hypothetical protein
VTTSAAAAGSTLMPSTEGSTFGALFSMTIRASCARGSTPPSASATSAPSLALSTTGLSPPSAAGTIDSAAPNRSGARVVVAVPAMRVTGPDMAGRANEANAVSSSSCVTPGGVRITSAVTAVALG